MHSSSHTTTTVTVRLDASEQFHYAGGTRNNRDKVRTALIRQIAMTVSDGSRPERVRMTGSGIGVKGNSLMIDREYEVPLETLSHELRTELFVQFRNSSQKHDEAQGNHALEGAWDSVTP